MRRSERSPLLRLCLMALATAHIAAISGEDFDGLVYRSSRDASLRSLSHSIDMSMIRKEPRSSHFACSWTEESYTEVATAILMLCYGDLFIKHTTDQAVHLQACRIVVDTGLILQEEKRNLNETLQFVIKEAEELEATDNVFSFRYTRRPASAISSGTRKSFWTFTSFIEDVTSAERESFAAHQSGVLIYSTDVESWISKLKIARNSIYAAGWSDFACAKLLKGGQALEKVIDMHYLACLIYVYQSFSPSSTNDDLLWAVSSLMDRLLSLSSDPEYFDMFAHDVYWPLFIIGTACPLDKVSQAAVTSMFMQSVTKTGHWCNHDALNFLEDFWAASTAATCEKRFGSWLCFARDRLHTMPSFIVF